jgi:hypothetical protein
MCQQKEEDDMEQQKRDKAAPWRRQRVLKKENIPEQYELLAMSRRLKTQQEQVFFILSYLLGGRITEIVRRKYEIKRIYKTIWVKDKKKGTRKQIIKLNENGSPIAEKSIKHRVNLPSIKAGDITFKEINGKQIMLVSMRNNKNRHFKRKNIPIPVHKEGDFVEIIRGYVQNMPPDQELFPFGPSNGQKILARINMNPHFLRDIRLTHLVTIYEYSSFHLVKFAGWHDARPAERYVRLGVSDLVEKF